MKIAVCLAGFLRSFKFTISGWNYRLKNLDCDVFIHAPNTYYAPPEEATYDSKPIDYVDHHIINNAFGSKLKNLVLYNYDCNIFKNVLLANNIPPLNNINQLTYRILSLQYNIQECIRSVILSKNNYDAILLSRADIILYENFNFDYCSIDKINYPIYHGLDLNGNFKTGTAAVFGTNKSFNDQMFISSFDNMIKLQNIYDMIAQYYSEGITINSETILGQHFIKNNIDTCASDFIKYDLLRFAIQ